MTEHPAGGAGNTAAVTHDDVERVANEWAIVFNHVGAGEVERLIIGAAGEEYFDDRTDLFLLARVEPTDVALVLTPSPGGGDGYVVVRFDGDAWVVDADPVDWDALEDRAFGDDGSDAL